MTVAFSVRRPWPRRTVHETERRLYGRWYWPTIVTIWHVDPERDGSDDSCDWFGRKRTLHPQERAIFEALIDLETLLDNRPHFPDSREHRAFQPLKSAVWALTRRRRARLHPRWHVWHWQVQIHALQAFKRWAWSRCAKCGRRFSWGYAPCSYNWNGGGPRWFRGEPGVFHQHCSGMGVAAANQGQPREGV